MKGIFSFFIVFMFIPVCHKSSAQGDPVHQKEINTDSLSAANTKKKIQEWKSVSLITDYLRRQGLKKVDLSTDTLFDLIARKQRHKIRVKVIKVLVPVYVPIADSVSYMKFNDSSFNYLYVDTVPTKKKGFLNKIFHKK